MLFEADVYSQPLVELVASHAAQIVPGSIEEQVLDQLLGVLQ